MAGYLDSRYTCCGGDIGTPGCAMGEVSCLLLLPVAGYLDSRYTCCGGDIGTPGWER